MFIKLDTYLSDPTITGEYWYDEASDIVEDMLDEFEALDWQTLISELPNKSVDYKIKLAYCINDNGNPYKLHTLLYMINTDNDDIFKVCIGSLVNFVSSSTKELFLKNNNLMDRLKSLMSNSDKVAYVVCENFLNKLKP